MRENQAPFVRVSRWYAASFALAEMQPRISKLIPQLTLPKQFFQPAKDK